MEEAIRLGANVVGGIPHFEFTRDYGVESVQWLVALAHKHDLLVDVHCDEIDDSESRFLEVLAAEALKLDYGSRVTASHTCAMGSYNDHYCSRSACPLCCPAGTVALRGAVESDAGSGIGT